MIDDVKYNLTVTLTYAYSIHKVPLDREALFTLSSVNPLSLCFFFFFFFFLLCFSPGAALTLSDGAMELSNSLPSPVIMVTGAAGVTPSLAANSACRSICSECLLAIDKCTGMLGMLACMRTHTPALEQPWQVSWVHLHHPHY